MDLLVAGLGNPGPRYRTTRHNLGFMVVDALAARHGASAERSKHGGSLREIRLPEGAALALFTPQSYMNVSGGPVARMAKAYGLGPERIVAVHDEVELPFGRVRAKQGGGLAGHNGLRSMAERLGTRDFLRVRLGVGRPRPGERRDMADWILAPFELDEDPEPMIGEAADAVELIARDGIEEALRRYG